MVDKLRTLQQAVAEFVPDGAHLALGGFTMQRHPMAFVRELIRQGRRDLVVYGHSPGIDLDMLIGAGAVKRIEIAYVGDEMFVSPGRNFRRALEQGLAVAHLARLAALDDEDANRLLEIMAEMKELQRIVPLAVERQTHFGAVFDLLMEVKDELVENVRAGDLGRTIGSGSDHPRP
jgi:hypothetical protein